jgi:hypothetical protein
MYCKSSFRTVAAAIAFFMIIAPLTAETTENTDARNLNEIALDLMREAARKDKKVRTAGGVILGVIGAVSIGAGAVLLPSATDESEKMIYTTGVVIGGALGVGSVAALLISSKTERVAPVVERDYDRESADQTAELRSIERSFGDLSDGRRNFRIIGSGFLVGLGLVDLFAVSPYVGGVQIGTGLFGLLMKSNAEKAYARYLEEKSRSDNRW